MAFNPSSTIYLCNVPIDSTYKNQIYFTSAAAQYSYFAGRSSLRFSEYLTVRETLPDGSLQSAVKVGANIDDLRGFNYMFYQNANHGSKFFYAFITKLIYINEKTTKIVFKTDVYQTWLFDVELLDSYVVREHCVSDELYQHTVPEKFDFNDFTHYVTFDHGLLDDWGYLIASTNEASEGDATARGRLMSGVYQGLYFYYFTSVNEINSFLDTLEEAGTDSVLFIAVIPNFCVSAVTPESNGYVPSSVAPAERTITFPHMGNSIKFGNYKPKNNKLYSYPYFKLIISNHGGDVAEYKIEDFASQDQELNRWIKVIKFKCFGDVSANPSVTMFPLDYKGISENYDAGVSIGGFPQCAFNSDTFKLWLAKNQFSIGLDTVGNIANIGVGIGSTFAGNPLGLVQAASGVTGILNSINSVNQASKEPNKSKGGGAKNNLLTAIGKNKFESHYEMIKERDAIIVDQFFTMYGYQTNRVKKPNVSSRPYFNYVQTIDVNIKGGIPADDMQELKSVYNNGVTLWKPSATVGNYSVDNSAGDGKTPIS